jgi:hypothetical protein
MKPTLTILLAAGSTANLGIGPLPIGMPSTTQLTEAIARMRHPAAIRAGVPLIFDETQTKASAFPHEVPLLPLITGALRRDFSYVDFEVILHAVEQLAPLVAGLDANGRSGPKHPVLSTFIELRRDSDLLYDRVALNAVRRAIIEEIHRRISGCNIALADRAVPLHLFIRRLEAEFRINVFTLNYDDIIDQARPSWFDGFTKPQSPPLDGLLYNVAAFDPSSFSKWRNAPEPLLAHLHGSVRFGYLRNSFGLGKYSHTDVAAKSLDIFGQRQAREGRDRIGSTNYLRAIEG